MTVKVSEVRDALRELVAAGSTVATAQYFPPDMEHCSCPICAETRRFRKALAEADRVLQTWECES